MLSSTFKAAVISFFLAVSVTAAPSNEDLDVRTILLDNGEQSVDVTNANPEARSVGDHGALLARQSSIDCRGSAFCERLGDSCDEAFRKVNPSGTYGTFQGQNSGTCSGTCGLFFSGGSCQGSGQELMNAYNAIRSIGHCTHCGRYRRDSDGCLIKIDRVTGC